MLTCVNPKVTFRGKEGQQHKGVAVALKWLLPLVRQFGGQDRIRREIKTLNIGDGKGDKKQHFNKFPNGTVISRGAGGVDVVSRSCVVIKESCFGEENRRAFREGTQNH